MQNFEGATYYDTREDCESLTHETPEAAICEWLEDGNEPAELKVFAFRRAVVSDEWIKHTAYLLAVRVIEGWDDEGYGDPDNESFDAAEVKSLEAKMENAVREFVATVKPWSCEVCGSRVYTKDEVAALVEPEAKP